MNTFIITILRRVLLFLVISEELARVWPGTYAAGLALPDRGEKKMEWLNHDGIADFRSKYPYKPYPHYRTPQMRPFGLPASHEREGLDLGVAIDRVPILVPQKSTQLKGGVKPEYSTTQSVPSSSAGGSEKRRQRLRRRAHPRYLHMQLCENNGTFVNGKCECPYPYVGVRCTDYACEHGLSVGPRYDPESTFFNRQCICDDDWAGDLCNIPINDQCNERGQYIKGRCKCHGYYFGPHCQYVGKCVNGKLHEGKCVCGYGYEGDYCDKIVCHHGYPDKANNSESCICPPRHAGLFCDECAASGPRILPYPNCTVEIVPYHARLSRQKTDSQIVARLIILSSAIALLLLLLLVMMLMHWGRRRASDPSLALIGRHTMEERKRTLERVIFLQTAAPNGVGPLHAFDPALMRITGQRRNSRFSDPNRLDHDMI